VLVPASYYKDSLVKAITAVLRERDGVGITEEMTVAQLQSGRFLILFDGLTEVAADDKSAASQEIFRAAVNFDFSSSRFVIATRQVEGLPAEITRGVLMPLTLEFLSSTISQSFNYPQVLPLS
jgi:hypothetical protein